MNLILSSPGDNAISWKSSYDPKSSLDEIPWIQETHTLVIGIGMSDGMYRHSYFNCIPLSLHAMCLIGFVVSSLGQGSNGDRVVAASVCLDKGCDVLPLATFRRSQKLL